MLIIEKKKGLTTMKRTQSNNRFVTMVVAGFEPFLRGRKAIALPPAPPSHGLGENCCITNMFGG